MPQKTNPRRRPATQADVEKARLDGREEGFNFTTNVMLFILADRYGWSIEQIDDFVKRFELYCTQIGNRNVKYADIVDTVRKEYGFDVELKRKGT